MRCLMMLYHAQAIVEHHETTKSHAPPETIDFGDVNIQLPETIVSNLFYSPQSPPKC